MFKHNAAKYLVVLSALVAGCTSFNRDALWNAPITREYCTYYEADFPPGSLFVHSQTDWTEKRLDYGYELKVFAVVDGWLILNHGWSYLSFGHWPDNACSLSELAYESSFANPGWLRTTPIAVKVLDPGNIKVGDLFTVYGQYKYLGTAPRKFRGKTVWMKHLKQINSSQENVAAPYPFIYFRWNPPAGQ